MPISLVDQALDTRAQLADRHCAGTRADVVSVKPRVTKEPASQLYLIFNIKEEPGTELLSKNAHFSK